MERYNVIQQAARAGGEAARSIIPYTGVVTKEGQGNFLTAADLASEKAIMDIITRNFPYDAILSEETETSLGNLLDIDHLWVIDPIDGTNNFRRGRGDPCVSVAYVERGVPQLAGVYNLSRNELFSAKIGQGAYLNEKLIAVDSETDITQCAIATDNSYDPEQTKHNLERLLRINPTPWTLIGANGIYTMCEVASGRINLYFHTALKPWDNAAGFLIVQEAGGVVKGLQGEDITFISPNAVVGNEQLVKHFVEAIK